MAITARVISGRWGEWLFIVYRLLWCAAFAFIFGINFYTSPRSEWIDRDNAVAAVRLALRTPAYQTPSFDGELIGPFGPAGQKMGVQPGDHLLAINGHELPADTPGQTALLSGPYGVPVTLTLRRDDGAKYHARIIRSSSYEREGFAGSGLNVARRRLASFLIDSASRLVGLVAAVILFLRRPRDPVAMLFCVAMLLNGFPVATSGTMWPGLGGVLVVAIAQFSLVLTGLLFPHGRMSTRWHWLALGIAVLTFYKDVCANMGYPTPIPITDGVYAAITVCSLISLLIAIVAEYRLTPEGLQRQQFKPVAFGTGIWIAFYLLGLLISFVFEGMFTNEGVSAWLKMAEWSCYSIAWMGFPLGLLVALSRYRLYDADTAISRTISYGVVTVSLLAVFAGAENIIQNLGSQYLGNGLGAMASGVAAAIAAAMMAPIHERVTGWTERRFRGALMDMRNGLPALLGHMRETASPKDLAHAALAQIAKGVYARRSSWMTMCSMPMAPIRLRFETGGKNGFHPLSIKTPWKATVPTRSFRCAYRSTPKMRALRVGCW